MSSTAGLELLGVDTLRPDLPIPLAPVGGPPEMVRRLAIGLREPSFRHARNVTLAWLAAAVATLVVSQTIVEASYTVFVLVVATALVGYTVLRAAALVVFELRQRAFESRWLDTQSECLRRRPFEILRFSLHASTDAPGADRRVYDLTDPDDMRRVLQRQQLDRDAPARAHIEFTYWLGAGDATAVESVRRELTDIEFFFVNGPITTARIRFPGARYIAQPGSGHRDERWPKRGAHWFLAGKIRITAASPRPTPTTSSG